MKERKILVNAETYGIHRGKINDNFLEIWTVIIAPEDVLLKANTTPFTPTLPYHPVTKAYADNLETNWQSIYNPQTITGDVFLRSNHTGDMPGANIVQDSNNRLVSDAEKAIWSGKEDAIGTKNTAFNQSYGTTPGTVAAGDHLHNEYEPKNVNIQSHIATNSGNPHSVTKDELGLGDVDNTTDLDKPVSTATQTALNAKSNAADVYTSGETDTLLAAKRAITNNQFGDTAGGNYSEFESNGTLVFHGTATVWNDISSSLIGRRLFSTTGTVDYDYDENAIVFSQGGSITSQDDRIGFSLQLPHGAMLGAGRNLKFHVHWVQENTTDMEFTVRYRVQANGAATTATWTTATASTNTNNVFTYTSGSLNQITPLVDIPLTAATISSVVEIQFTRTDSNGGTLAAKFADCHVEIEKVGSDNEFS